MKIIRTLEAFNVHRATLKNIKELGFLPTMGCLHKGHEQLMERCVRENDYTILSLFVNPTQFNRANDYHAYPRCEETDLRMAEKARIDCVFLPTPAMVYPPSDEYFNVTTSHPASRILEGYYRPGHFNGVVTVVLKLLILIRPTRAYFGEKDYQQYLIIKDLVDTFLLDTEVIACATVRARSKLAYSSRNKRLSETQLKTAHLFAQIFHAEDDPERIKEKLKQNGIRFDYVAPYQGRLFAAVYIDDIRLIDNKKVL